MIWGKAIRIRREIAQQCPKLAGGQSCGGDSTGSSDGGAVYTVLARCYLTFTLRITTIPSPLLILLFVSPSAAASSSQPFIELLCHTPFHAKQFGRSNDLWCPDILDQGPVSQSVGETGSDLPVLLQLRC